MSKMLTVAVQSPEGQKRIQVTPFPPPLLITLDF